MDGSNNDIVNLKKHGLYLIEKHRLDEAKALFSEIIAMTPNDAEAWYQLSTVHGKLGQYEEAVECSRHAISIRPDYIDAYLALGSACFRKSCLEEALAHYHQAIKIDPGCANAHFGVGLVHASLGRYKEAVDYYRQGLRLDPSEKFYIMLHQQGTSLMQADNLEGAGLLFGLACEMDPNDIEAWYSLSTIYGQQGRIDESADCCRRVLAISPKHIGAHSNLGLAYLVQGKINEAASTLSNGLAISPDCVTLLNNLARTCLTPDHLERYLKSYRNSLPHIPDRMEIRIAFIKAVENYIPAKYEPWLDAELRECFSIKDADFQPISSLVARILKQKYSIDATSIRMKTIVYDAIGWLVSDELFRAFLEKTINCDADIEILLTEVRRILLFRHCQEGNLDEGEKKAVTTLAHHNFNNEYVFETHEDEIGTVNTLKKSLEERLPMNHISSRDLEISLSVLAMYYSLESLSGKEYLANMPRTDWSNEFLPMLNRMLLEPMDEAAIMGDIESIGPIKDSISQLVQSQYEENPYPRWVAIPNSTKTNIRHVLKLEFPNFVQPDFLQGPIRMLIAGCGTGRHPILNALYLSKNHEVEILALDISRRSLSYAIRMARKYNVKNIKFMHGDILDVHNLNKRFHIIESQGVLHHMERPLDGWRALRQILEKDGLMSIGLYSKAGRASLAEIQNRFKQEGLTPDDQNIRKFRGRILRGEWDNIRFESPDFYSMSGCRDLLFHFQEHQYTTQLIADSLRDLKLSFIGFNFEDLGTKHLYRKHFPQDTDMTNLSLWGEFENKFPDTFAKMYRFWCQGQ